MFRPSKQVLSTMSTIAVTATSPEAAIDPINMRFICFDIENFRFSDAEGLPGNAATNGAVTKSEYKADVVSNSSGAEP